MYKQRLLLCQRLVRVFLRGNLSKRIKGSLESLETAMRATIPVTKILSYCKCMSSKISTNIVRRIKKLSMKFINISLQRFSYMKLKQGKFVFIFSGGICIWGTSNKHRASEKFWEKIFFSKKWEIY